MFGFVTILLCLRFLYSLLCPYNGGSFSFVFVFVFVFFAFCRYAAQKVYESLTPPFAHENMVKCGAYILGEYGYFLNDEPGELQVLGRSLWRQPFLTGLIEFPSTVKEWWWCFWWW